VAGLAAWRLRRDSGWGMSGWGMSGWGMSGWGMGASLEVSTDQIPQKMRLEFWRERFSETIGVVPQFPREAEDKFDAAFTLENKGPIIRLRFRSDSHEVTRDQRTIDNRPWNGYVLYRELSPGAWVQSGAEAVTPRGCLAVIDADRPFQTRALRHFEHDSLIVPREFIDPHVRGSKRPRMDILTGVEGIEALAFAYLDALGREWGQVPEAAMGQAADALGRLIGVACGAAAGEHSGAVEAARLAQARQYVERHLTDPDLSAARAAAALRISERTLFALFETSGTSFAAHVRRRRLEECRASLIADPERSVMDIALAWGFGSMPSFYRAFQAAFGASPGDLREEAALRRMQRMRRDRAENETTKRVSPD
jgi:AraC-like DNA-binding protein